MISVSPARSAEDFETMAGLCRKLAQWDVDAVQPYGVSEEDVRTIFHPERSGSSLAAKFGAPDAMAFIARSENLPAGCLALTSSTTIRRRFTSFLSTRRFAEKESAGR
ncbi:MULTISPECIES: hypothetical protein [unclassified Mesorhizobium]